MIPREELARRLALLFVTDPDVGPGRELVEVVRAALRGGATAVQLRAKSAGTREMVELGRRLREDTAALGALLFVNDRVDVALAIGADGAHVGDDDLPLVAVRSIAPPGFVVGRSVDSAGEAETAEREGADYVGVGPVTATPSKLDAAAPIGVEGIAAVRAATGLPLVAIGGIDLANAEAVARAGADGVAVIRALTRSEDPERAARELLEAVRRGQRG
jgi:thiamine-phosphate pyrophosphorylase